MSGAPDPAEQPTMTVEEAGEAFGVSRATAYEAVKAGHIPSLRISGRIVIPTAPSGGYCNSTTSRPNPTPARPPKPEDTGKGHTEASA